MSNVLHDVGAVPYNLISKDTFYAGVVFVPAWGISRTCDSVVHGNYYCEHCHQNIHQMPRWCHEISDKGTVAICLGTGIPLVFWPDPEIRDLGRVYLIGVVYTWLIKDLFKTVKCDENFRPTNGDFDWHKKYYGGCPSGHMAISMYMTTFFAKSCGWQWALPFAAWSGAVFYMSLNGNRHYTSQLVAGACLGAALGCAASKVFQGYQSDRFSCGFGVSDNGSPALKMSYTF